MNISIAATESVSEAVIRGVSAFESRPATDLPPLYETIEPDALDALCTSPPDTPRNTIPTVSFVYSTAHVRVDGSETIHLSTPSSQQSAE